MELNLEESDSLAHSDKVTPRTLYLGFLIRKTTIKLTVLQLQPPDHQSIWAPNLALRRHKATTLSPGPLLRQINPRD